MPRNGFERLVLAFRVLACFLCAHIPTPLNDFFLTLLWLQRHKSCISLMHTRLCGGCEMVKKSPCPEQGSWIRLWHRRVADEVWWSAVWKLSSGRVVCWSAGLWVSWVERRAERLELQQAGALSVMTVTMLNTPIYHMTKKKIVLDHKWSNQFPPKLDKITLILDYTMIHPVKPHPFMDM